MFTGFKLTRRYFKILKRSDGVEVSIPCTIENFAYYLGRIGAPQWLLKSIASERVPVPADMKKIIAADFLFVDVVEVSDDV